MDMATAYPPSVDVAVANRVECCRRSESVPPYAGASGPDVNH